MNLTKFCEKIIYFFYLLLFFLVPLFLTPFNYELFEFNKIMLTYVIAATVTIFWLIKKVIEKNFSFIKTPFDFPYLFFLIASVISTIYSIDPHVSLWGYYSRFNGGLVSLFAYYLLFFVFVQAFAPLKSHGKQNNKNSKTTKELIFIKSYHNYRKIVRLLKVALLGGFLVAVYGILEHFGIDKDIWVQDVQNRVFSTFGQPNWLAAYLAILIPISLGIALIYIINYHLKFSSETQNAKRRTQNAELKPKILNFLANWQSGLFIFFSIIYYIALLFTKSRSGFSAFWFVNIIFWLLAFLVIAKEKKGLILKYFIIFNFSLFAFNFFFGSPFPQMDRFTINHVLKMKYPNQATVTEATNNAEPAMETGGTESGTIRRIVWQGAVEIFRNYPTFGTGLETFAFAYYRFKPTQHNLTSEWDFLYNKAHNEYLNYAATTGALGITSYLLIIVSVFFYSLWVIIKKMRLLKNYKYQSDIQIVSISIFCAWLSILITNFFGFSVTVTSICFYLLPGFLFLLYKYQQNFSENLEFLKKTDLLLLNSNKADKEKNGRTKLSFWQKFTIAILLIVLFAVYVMVGRFWYADKLYASVKTLVNNHYYANAYDTINSAQFLNPNEPQYYDEKSELCATLAVLAFQEKQATLSAKLVQEAIENSNQALAISPQNVNFWKTRTRVFYYLTITDQKYFEQAIDSLLIAQSLAPTDAKIVYNLGIIYEKIEEHQKAIDTLKKAIELKSNYQDPRMALATIYEDEGKMELAKEQLEYVLKNINPQDENVKKKLKDLNK